MLGANAALPARQAVLALADEFSAFKPILLQALAEDPAERYPDLRALASALRTLDVSNSRAATKLAHSGRDSARLQWAPENQ